ncbi:uncharacterized protein METZ01_LOCUS67796, partial [marine metagenome]
VPVHHSDDRLRRHHWCQNQPAHFDQNFAVMKTEVFSVRPDRIWLLNRRILLNW